VTAQPVELTGQGALDLGPVERVLPVDPVIDAVTVGLDAGESPHAIAKGLGLKLESVRKHLTRHGRRDLLDALSAVTPGAPPPAGNPGARTRTVPAQRGDGRRPAHLDVDGRTPCQDAPDDWFDTEREASAVFGCRVHCPVRVQCARLALARREEWGVWGGLTPGDRRRILAERADR